MSLSTLNKVLKHMAGKHNQKLHAGSRGKAPSQSESALDINSSDPEVQRLLATDKILNDPDVLKDLELPPKLYHVTSKANLESIQKNGIIPGKPRASSDGVSLGAYLSDDPHDVLNKQPDIKLSDAVVLEVDTSKLTGLRLDPEYFYYSDKTKAGARDYVQGVNDGEEQYAVYSRMTIPPSAFKIKGSK